MNDSPLNKDLIADTSFCQLGLRLGATALDAMIYNPMEENSLIVRSFPIAPSGESRLKDIENIIYDNPLLLNEFKKVSIIVETPDFIIVPESAGSEETLRSLLEASHPDIAENAPLIVNPLNQFGAVIATAMNQQEHNFLSRTFFNAHIANSFVPLIRYFSSQLSEGSTTRAFVNVRSESADIVVMSHSRLNLVNRFRYRDAADLQYYTLAATDPTVNITDSICVTGSRPLRDELIRNLRQFRQQVIPLIFPSAMYTAGRASLNAPFDLIILPLCE